MSPEGNTAPVLWLEKSEQLTPAGVSRIEELYTILKLNSYITGHQITELLVTGGMENKYNFL